MAKKAEICYSNGDGAILGWTSTTNPEYLALIPNDIVFDPTHYILAIANNVIQKIKFEKPRNLLFVNRIDLIVPHSGDTTVGINPNCRFQLHLDALQLGVDLTYNLYTFGDDMMNIISITGFNITWEQIQAASKIELTLTTFTTGEHPEPPPPEPYF